MNESVVSATPGMTMTQGMYRLIRNYGKAERDYGKHGSHAAAIDVDLCGVRLADAIISLEVRNSFLEARLTEAECDMTKDPLRTHPDGCTPPPSGTSRRPVWGYKASPLIALLPRHRVDWAMIVFWTVIGLAAAVISLVLFELL